MKLGVGTGLPINQFAIFMLSVFVAAFVGLTGCQRHSTDSEPRLAEPYSPANGAWDLISCPSTAPKVPGIGWLPIPTKAEPLSFVLNWTPR
jgi:hypothetical protein